MKKGKFTSKATIKNALESLHEENRREAVEEMLNDDLLVVEAIVETSDIDYDEAEDLVESHKWVLTHGINVIKYFNEVVEANNTPVDEADLFE